MIRRLKTILLRITIITMAVSVVGVPSFYHHCLLHGDHNWQVGFIPDTQNHCLCCENIEDEHVHACSELFPSCYENVQQHQNETTVTYSKCCNIKIISLQVIAAEHLVKQQFKQLLDLIYCIDISYQYISNRILPFFNFSLPLPYLDFSPPQVTVFLFTQFLS